MDAGIWAIWFNLDPAKRQSHLDWMHGTYLPGMVSHPGIAWAAHYACREDVYKAQRATLPHTDAAIPQGTQFIQLIAAASPHLFFRADSPLLDENLSAETKARLAEREEARLMVLVEEERVTGPRYDMVAPGGVPGPAIQMGSFNMTSVASEIEIGKWYAQLRMPDMSANPASIRVRKMASIVGWAKHAILYEFASLEEREKHFKKADDPFSKVVIPETVHCPGSPSVAERIWPAA